MALRVDSLRQAKTLQILGGSDLAEPFDVPAPAATTPDPGSVVVIDPARPGELRVSDAAYDARVAGVISGANHLAPGMVMRSEESPFAHGDHPVAPTGRVWCKVDASFGAVHPGDLLTTSPAPGHAMVPRAVFVDGSSGNPAQAGTPRSPYHTASGGNAAALPGNDLVIRAGTYAAGFTLSTPTRVIPDGGAVKIGP